MLIIYPVCLLVHLAVLQIETFSFRVTNVLTYLT
jgi:hypothetical protein